MIDDIASEDVDDFLAHFGVKGMKWGVRKDRSDSDSPSVISPGMTSEQKKAVAKKVAIGTGSLILAAGVAYAAYKLNSSGSTKLSSMVPNDVAKTKVDDLLKKPVTILHASRGKNRGFKFFNDGNYPSPLAEYEKAFGTNEFTAGLKRYEGKIAASFLDPKGRLDRSGRLIPHQVIIPESMTKGINTLDDVTSKIWPTIEKDYVYD